MKLRIWPLLLTCFLLASCDGKDEDRCYDTTADPAKIYYYGAFAYDDLGNISTPTEDSQWLSSNLDPHANLPYTSTPLLPYTQKYLREGQVYILKDNKTFNLLGMEVL